MFGSEKKRKSFVGICALAIIQSFLRFAILAVILVNGWPTMERSVSSGEQTFILAMFLMLGITGIVFTIGMWMSKDWGLLGTIGISGVTIAFDIWAIWAVQMTAIMGLFLPILFIGYLIVMRQKLVSGVMVDEGARGVRN